MYTNIQNVSNLTYTLNEIIQLFSGILSDHDSIVFVLYSHTKTRLAMTI